MQVRRSECCFREVKTPPCPPRKQSAPTSRSLRSSLLALFLSMGLSLLVLWLTAPGSDLPHSHCTSVRLWERERVRVCERVNPSPRKVVLWVLQGKSTYLQSSSSTSGSWMSVEYPNQPTRPWQLIRIEECLENRLENQNFINTLDFFNTIDQVFLLTNMTVKIKTFDKMLLDFMDNIFVIFLSTSEQLYEGWQTKDS